MLVRDFQAIIGKEAKLQHYQKTGKLSDGITTATDTSDQRIGQFACFMTF